jgi:membrane AbrB-like protein
MRILLLTTVVPIGALFMPVGQYQGPPTGPVIPWPTLIFVTLACAAVGFVFTKLRVPAAYALGAMAAAMTAKFAGWFDGTMPPQLLVLAFVLVGALIGSRFGGISLTEFRKAAIGGVLGTALTVAIVTVVAFGAARLVDMPFGQIWLGLSPGGLESMGALGIALGFDTAFIAAHHVARLLLLTIAIPAVVMLVRQRE